MVSQHNGHSPEKSDSDLGITSVIKGHDSTQRAKALQQVLFFSERKRMKLAAAHILQ